MLKLELGENGENRENEEELENLPSPASSPYLYIEREDQEVRKLKNAHLWREDQETHRYEGKTKRHLLTVESFCLQCTFLNAELTNDRAEST